MWTRIVTPFGIVLALETALCSAHVSQGDRGWTILIGNEVMNRPGEWPEERVKAVVAHLLQTRLRAAATSLEELVKPLDDPRWS